jgi:hypothetical protein
LESPSGGEKGSSGGNGGNGGNGGKGSSKPVSAFPYHVEALGAEASRGWCQRVLDAVLSLQVIVVFLVGWLVGWLVGFKKNTETFLVCSFCGKGQGKSSALCLFDVCVSIYQPEPADSPTYLFFILNINK